jgi:hypothetical protein
MNSTLSRNKVIQHYYYLILYKTKGAYMQLELDISFISTLSYYGQSNNNVLY